MPESIDVIFLWLIGDDYRGRFLSMISARPLIEDGRYGCQLGFGFRRLSDKLLGHLVRFFCGFFGGHWRKVHFDDQQRRSFKMAARQPYLISFLSII
jgi:hypothetical protein